MDGVVRTRVGYAGGTKANPTYHGLGDHTETVEIDYDPAKISYEQLLEVFWRGHNPAAAPWSRQYMAAVFYRDEEQERLAHESAERVATALGRPVLTRILPYDRFWVAEEYHQKYRLRHDHQLMREFALAYPDDRDFVRSTAAARVNGYLDGYGSAARLGAEVESLGLSPEGAGHLRDRVNGRRI